MRIAWVKPPHNYAVETNSFIKYGNSASRTQRYSASQTFKSNVLYLTNRVYSGSRLSKYGLRISKYGSRMSVAVLLWPEKEGKRDTVTPYNKTQFQKHWIAAQTATVEKDD